MPACASCKHQRKKCTEKCVLSPFFPAEKTREFRAVHKVFGVSNITKIVRSLKEEDKKKAIDSLVWEAFCRQRDPVWGPYGEYKRVCDELKLYKSQCQRIQLGAVVYEAAPVLGAWNNNNGACNNKGMNMNGGGGSGHSNAFNYVQNNGNYSFNQHMHNLERLRQEQDLGSIANGSSQSCYLPG
ncbi:LOB domain-containing protein 2 [Diospyros lotus]|uniref:LOB domain-containing protein 2 n=1 Tax=Diospyros lotus TaxID=55363 RepID=UPI0022530589|nr:LOB domain-containing protein 2 [Diospyros lotus]